MFLLTAHNDKDKGGYAVHNKSGEKILFLFEEEDDAVRYALMLEEQDDIEMEVVEVEDDIAIKACKLYNYKYAVITPNDIVIPPKIE